MHVWKIASWNLVPQAGQHIQSLVDEKFIGWWNKRAQSRSYDRRPCRILGNQKLWVSRSMHEQNGYISPTKYGVDTKPKALSPTSEVTWKFEQF